MKLDYGTMISSYPIRLTVGTVKKPTIDDVERIGFDEFGLIEGFLSLNPKNYYAKNKDENIEYWDSLSEAEKESLSIFQAIEHDITLQHFYLNVFRFFFEEPVDYASGFFIILKDGTEINDRINQEDILSVINETQFVQLLSIFKQICGIKISDDEFNNIPDSMFKNAKAKELYERMQKNKVIVEENVEKDLNYSLPNIISSVVARHSSINYLNVGRLTVYQLLDLFNRMRSGMFYDIDQTRVSVWGDEKNTFKPDGWYKNEYDKKDS